LLRQTPSKTQRRNRLQLSVPTSRDKTLIGKIWMDIERLDQVLLVMPDRALADVKAAEAAIEADRSKGPLHGSPIAHEDFLLRDVQGIRIIGRVGCYH